MLTSDLLPSYLRKLAGFHYSTTPENEIRKSIPLGGLVHWRAVRSTTGAPVAESSYN